MQVCLYQTAGFFVYNVVQKTVTKTICFKNQVEQTCLSILTFMSNTKTLPFYKFKNLFFYTKVVLFYISILYLLPTDQANYDQTGQLLQNQVFFLLSSSHFLSKACSHFVLFFNEVVICKCGNISFGNMSIGNVNLVLVLTKIMPIFILFEALISISSCITINM